MKIEIDNWLITIINEKLEMRRSKAMKKNVKREFTISEAKNRFISVVLIY